MLELKTHSAGSFIVLELNGTLLDEDAILLEKSLKRKFGKIKFLAIDLSAITKICSLTLGVIVKARQRIYKKGGKLVVLSPTPVIRKLLKETKLDNVIPVIENEQGLIGYLQE